MTQIYKDGSVRVCTGWQAGLYGDTLLNVLFNNESVKHYDGSLFSKYYEQAEGKLNNKELCKLKRMLSDVNNEKYVIQETEDDIYFAWIGVIIAGEKEWSFYDDDVDDRMEILFTYLRELSKKVLEHKSKTGNLTYPNNDSQYNYGEEIIHSAIVYSVDLKGNTTSVISKMGQEGISINHPRAPGFYDNYKGYSTSRAYFRKKQVR